MRLSHHYVVPHVSTGDMLRAAVKPGTALGLQGQGPHGPGRAAPRRPGHGDGGRAPGRARRPGPRLRPRRLPPHRAPGRAAGRSVLAPFDLDLVIDLEVHTEPGPAAPGHPAGLRRLRGQLLASAARRMVNWTCDVCGGEVVQREDDTEEAIERRLELYEGETAPLLDWYKQREPAGRGQRHRLARRGDPPGGQGHRQPLRREGRMRARRAGPRHEAERRTSWPRCAGPAGWWPRCTRPPGRRPSPG